MNPLNLVDLCKGKKVYIQTHNFPDPDAIASAFGLQKLLEHYGVEALLCHAGIIDKLSSVKLLDMCGIKMNAYETIRNSMSEEDIIILVDCQKNNGNTTDFIGDEVACIDHHPTLVEVDYQYFDLRIVGSCASIIADYYRTLEIAPSSKVATALMYGLRTDTLSLTRGVKEFDVDMYSYLFRYHDAELMKLLESDNMELADLRAYGAAINNIKIVGKVGFSYLDFSCPDALVAILSDFIVSVAEIQLSIIYAGRDDGYKLSVRSERSDIHAGELIYKAIGKLGNAGGHATNAGGFVKKSVFDSDARDNFEQMQNLFLEVIEKDYPWVLKG